MLDKLYEGIIDIAIMSFLLILFIYKIGIISHTNFEILYLTDKFYAGRIILKYFTESRNFSYGICNLSSNIFLMNNQTFFNYLNNISITDPSELLLENLSNGNTTIYGYNIESDDFQFQRVCYYDGSLFLVQVKVQ